MMMIDLGSKTRSQLGRALVAGLALCLLPSLAWAGKEPKKTVAVTAFENQFRQVNVKDYEFGGDMGNLGHAMAEKLIDALLDTGKFVVLDRLNLQDVLAEQNLDSVAPVSPELRKRLTTAQALIRGVISNVELIGNEEGGVNLMGVGVKFRNQRLRVEINLRIIDTTTGQVIGSETVEGIAKMRGMGLNLSRGDLKTDVKGSRNLPIGKAMDAAVQQAVRQIVDGMARIPWQGRVARVSGQQLFINAGRQENVEAGLRLAVFQEGARLIDPETNEDLGTLDEEIGLVQVVQVGPRFAVAEVLEGRGFARGNIVRPEF